MKGHITDMSKVVEVNFGSTRKAIGSYIFKVQIKTGVWRKIQISKTATLDKLHKAILTAYDFDNDHLYAFFMDNKAWSDYDSYWSPYNEEGPYANRKKLLDLDFVKGKKFMYLYDFGDEWHFTVSFEKEIGNETKKPVIIQIKGDAPLQYPDWSYDEDDDEMGDEADYDSDKLEPIDDKVNEDAEIGIDLTLKYISPIEYVKINGYPVTGIDFLAMDFVNLAGYVIKEKYNLANAKIKTALIGALPKIKVFYLHCQVCDNRCYHKISSTINLEAMCKKNSILTDGMPENLIENKMTNFIYLEFVANFATILYEELRKVTGKAKADEMRQSVANVLIRYISDNCIKDCKDKCLITHDQNAYCDFCAVADGNLLCPKDNSRLYDIIKATPEDMID